MSFPDSVNFVKTLKMNGKLTLIAFAHMRLDIQIAKCYEFANLILYVDCSLIVAVYFFRNLHFKGRADNLVPDASCLICKDWA